MHYTTSEHVHENEITKKSSYLKLLGFQHKMHFFLLFASLQEATDETSHQHRLTEVITADLSLPQTSVPENVLAKDISRN